MGPDCELHSLARAAQLGKLSAHSSEAIGAFTLHAPILRAPEEAAGSRTQTLCLLEEVGEAVLHGAEG